MKPRRGWVLAAMCAAAAACSSNDKPPANADASANEGPSVKQDSGQADAGSLTDAALTDAAAPSAQVCERAGGHPPRPPTGIVGEVQSLDVPPPPVSGGTLVVSADGLWAVAADPDRDQIYVVDLDARALVHTVSLDAGDEPGRVALDDSGHAHVALRGGGAVVSIDLATGAVIDRRAVCDLPRGIAYDASDDSLYVGCYEGRVVHLDASGGAPAQTYELSVGVRDVVVQADAVRVSRFREAELLTLDKATGALRGQSSTPPPFALATVDTETCEPTVKRFEPALGWRTVMAPDGSTMMLHQRQQTTEVPTGKGGYGVGPFCDSGVVQTVVTRDTGDGAPISAALPAMAMAVDMAVSPDGTQLAVGGLGNTSWGGQVVALSMATYMDAAQQEQPSPQEEFTVEGCARLVTMASVEGESISVAFDPAGNLLVQSREPSTLQFIEHGVLVGEQVFSPSIVSLGTESRRDTGHQLFHYNTSGGIACASCHAEGGDDGNVWTFKGLGPRRTQNLRGGLLGTEPLHWSGDMKDFPTLFDEVFVGRMTGFPLDSTYTDALATWIDKQPSLARTPSDADAVQRGRALFESTEVGCATCHSGSLLTNNTTVDVGTGGAYQVPSLKGVSFRAPFLHDGCAQTLRDRFGECGGGDRHGNTSQLSESDLDDLLAYLQTL